MRHRQMKTLGFFLAPDGGGERVSHLASEDKCQMCVGVSQVFCAV